MQGCCVRVRIVAMSRQSVSIIVPTYKEAENIPILVERVFTALAEAGIDGEMVIVDDNSRDGSDKVVEGLAGRFPVRIITRTDERGLSSAVVRGFEEARHDILLCMDADLSHPPEAVPSVVGKIASNEGDFCIGSRYTEGGRTKEDWGLLRKINSLGATWLARPLTSARDPMAGFFCLTRETFERAKAAGLNPVGYKIALEIMIKADCRKVAEVPIEFSDRLHGESKLTFAQQLLYLQHLGRLYRFRLPWLVPVIIVLVVAGAAAIVYALAR